MIRCPIYCCNKLIGCNACKTLNLIQGDGLKAVNTKDSNWIELLHSNNIGLITDSNLPRELVWELSSNSNNSLQVNCCLIDDDLQWVVNLVHLTEVCGIKCTLVMYPILPNIVPVSGVIKVLDAIKNCENCTVALKFGQIYLNDADCKDGQLVLSGKTLPLKNLNKSNKFLWKCCESYTEEFYQIVKFYTDSTKLNLIVLEA